MILFELFENDIAKQFYYQNVMAVISVTINNNNIKNNYFCKNCNQI